MKKGKTKSGNRTCKYLKCLTQYFQLQLVKISGGGTSIFKEGEGKGSLNVQSVSKQRKEICFYFGLEWYTEIMFPVCLHTHEDWKLVLILNGKLEFSYELAASRRRSFQKVIQYHDKSLQKV